MPCSQGDLKDRPREEQPFWGDTAGVALPGMEQASLSTTVILGALHQGVYVSIFDAAAAAFTQLSFMCSDGQERKTHVCY